MAKEMNVLQNRKGHKKSSNKSLGREDSEKLSDLLLNTVSEPENELKDANREEPKRRSKHLQLLENDKFPNALRQFYEQRGNSYYEV